MKSTYIITGKSWEDDDLTCLARIHVNGENMLQADLASIERNIYDLGSDTPTVAIDTSAPVVADVVFDALQLDGMWQDVAVGYNFRERIAGAEFPTGGRTYRIVYRFTGADGELFRVVFQDAVQASYTD